jgi:hypothetical protein
MSEIQSRSMERRLRVQMSARLEDKLRDFRRTKLREAAEEDHIAACIDFMLSYVNDKRASLFGKAPVGRELVAAANQQASGQDYERRFAESCVELVLA